ncbi:MAG: hypothetical protein PVF43_15055, partial [Candidatus Eiseniibacteriota bacterium]
MSRIAVVLMMGCVLSASSALGAVSILNLSGNNFSMDEPAAQGGQLRIAAELSQAQDMPPITLPGITTWSTEYTVYVYGLILESEPTGFQRNFSGGHIEIWAQNPPNAPWTPTTPVSSIPAFSSGVVPASFTDGTMLLKGAFSSFTILDFTMFGSATGTITNTDIDWTGGTSLSELIAQGIQNDWVWSGWFDVGAPVPGGYQMLYGGKLEVETPTPVEPRTWGSIKAL